MCEVPARVAESHHLAVGEEMSSWRQGPEGVGISRAMP